MVVKSVNGNIIEAPRDVATRRAGDKKARIRWPGTICSRRVLATRHHPSKTTPTLSRQWTDIRGCLHEIEAVDSGGPRNQRPDRPHPDYPHQRTRHAVCAWRRPSLLVMFVVFLFLRRGAPTIAAGITVPLSLAGTCARDVADWIFNQ